MKTNFDKYQIFQGLSCCAEFFCDGCPYKKYEHDLYKIQCIHMLIEDLHEYMKSEESLNPTRPVTIDELKVYLRNIKIADDDDTTEVPAIGGNYITTEDLNNGI